MNYYIAYSILGILLISSISIVIAGRLGGETHQCFMRDFCLQKEDRYFRWRECTIPTYSGYIHYSQADTECQRIKREKGNQVIMIEN